MPKKKSHEVAKSEKRRTDKSAVPKKKRWRSKRGKRSSAMTVYHIDPAELAAHGTEAAIVAQTLRDMGEDSFIRGHLPD